MEEKILCKSEEEVLKVLDKFVQKFDICINQLDGEIDIHEPVFTNIPRSDKYELSFNGEEIATIRTNKLAITFWLKSKGMHITVFP